jgi:hypothetical protein
MTKLAITLSCAMLLVALSQPIWRGPQIVAQIKSDCTKRGGVLLEHSSVFGSTYECKSWLGGGK